MKVDLLPFLRCINCSCELKLQSIEHGSKQSKQSKQFADLVCTKCNASYPVIDGVPSFCGDALSLDITAMAFSNQWSNRVSGYFEGEDVFGFSQDDYIKHFCYAFNIEDIANLEGVIVEAGIGTGHLVVALSKLAPNATVIGLDISSSVFGLTDQVEKIPNLHLIQCDLTNPPLRLGFANKVYASGVLHHLKDVGAGIKSLWRLTANNGTLYFWIYPNYSFCLYDCARCLLVTPYKLYPNIRLILSWILAPIFWCYFKLTNKYSYRNSMEKISTIAFRLFDNLSPEFQHRFSKEQATNLCHEAGIYDLEIINDLGVRCKRAKE